MFTHKHTPHTHMYTPHPTNTRIPHPGEGGGHGSESHCQRPNGRVSREHGRRLHVRIETVSSTTSSTLKAPWAARQRGGCGNENDIARSSVAPRTGAGGYTSGARRRCAWTGVGCVAARTQVSFWRRRRKHGVGWQPMLAVEARGTRDSGAIDASDNQHDDESSRTCPCGQSEQ